MVADCRPIMSHSSDPPAPHLPKQTRQGKKKANRKKNNFHGEQSCLGIELAGGVLKPAKKMAALNLLERKPLIDESDRPYGKFACIN